MFDQKKNCQQNTRSMSIRPTFNLKDFHEGHIDADVTASERMHYFTRHFLVSLEALQDEHLRIFPISSEKISMDLPHSGHFT